MMHHYHVQHVAASASSSSAMATATATAFGSMDDPTCLQTNGDTSPMVLRIRLPDGSIQKIQVPSKDVSLKEVLQQSSICDNVDNDDNNQTVIWGTNNELIHDDSQSLSALGLKHGSLITIRNKSRSILENDYHNQKTAMKPSFANDDNENDSPAFQPFPDLHKNYQAAIRAKRARTKGRASSSFADLSNIHASLHVVDHQPEGPLQRVYMCHQAATRFQSTCTTGTSATITGTYSTFQNRVGLLLGTIQRERVDNKTKKVRTSLSTIPSEQDFCQVAKVHAIWEPQQQHQQQKHHHNHDHDHDDDEICYDASALLDRESTNMQRVLTVANYLGLQPVGWIFTYSDNRHVNKNNNIHKNDNGDTTIGPNDDDGQLPVWACDIVTGAQLQISEMKARDRTDGAKFVTLAMEAQTGATEAFQLSNVAVQMVAENMLMTKAISKSYDTTNHRSTTITETNTKSNKKMDHGLAFTSPSRRNYKNGRFVKTRHAIVVDGREVDTLDTVLCLVNTALLSHLGLYAGNTKKKPIKKNGSLTLNTKKTILASISIPTTTANKNQKNNTTKDSALLNLLSDFNILLALDILLGNDTDTQELCRVVQKWVRGQKHGTQVSDTLKRKLQNVLSH